jgi:hypothetical protein
METGPVECYRIYVFNSCCQRCCAVSMYRYCSGNNGDCRIESFPELRCSPLFCSNTAATLRRANMWYFSFRACMPRPLLVAFFPFAELLNPEQRIHTHTHTSPPPLPLSPSSFHRLRSTTVTCMHLLTFMPSTELPSSKTAINSWILGTEDLKSPPVIWMTSGLATCILGEVNGWFLATVLRQLQRWVSPSFPL